MKNPSFRNWKLALSFMSVLFLLHSNAVFGQGSKHSQTWNFGQNCRLRFSPNMEPLASVDPAIDTVEGSASFADPASGALLLYTDGRKAWDSAGVVVVDDLLGSLSVMHAAVIVPRPEHPNHVYIIVHTKEESSKIGIREFDLSDPQNISVVGENISIELDAQLGAREGMVVVPHTNGLDFWVIVAGDKKLFVLPITSEGVIEVRTTATNISSGPFGLFAVSNDGKKLVMSGSDSTGGDISSLAFDPATGEFEQENGIAKQTFLTSNAERRKYGGAFSPDDSKLYYVTLGVSGVIPPVPSSLFQYDFTLNKETLINRQEVGFYHGQTKLGPDGKIYVATGLFDKSVLSVISRPNESAGEVDFSFASLNLIRGCMPVLGLPQTLSPQSSITLGIEILSPEEEIDSNRTTPSGSANLPDGSGLIIVVVGEDGYMQRCEATVQAGKWSCPEGAIAGLSAGSTYQMTASNEQVQASRSFTFRGCKRGSQCDLDECELNTDNCHENARCEDLLDGFQCTCETPFIGDGVDCVLENQDMGGIDGSDMGKDISDDLTDISEPRKVNRAPLVLAGGCSTLPSFPGSLFFFILVCGFILFGRKKNIENSDKN